MDERRSVQRTRILRNAEIVVSQGVTCTKIQCTLQDLTSTGACLLVASTHRVPDTFDLTFDQGRSCRPCQVKWRTHDKLGVAFEPAAA